MLKAGSRKGGRRRTGKAVRLMLSSNSNGLPHLESRISGLAEKRFCPAYNQLNSLENGKAGKVDSPLYKERENLSGFQGRTVSLSQVREML